MVLQYGEICEVVGGRRQCLDKRVIMIGHGEVEAVENGADEECSVVQREEREREREKEDKAVEQQSLNGAVTSREVPLSQPCV